MILTSNCFDVQMLRSPPQLAAGNVNTWSSHVAPFATASTTNNSSSPLDNVPFAAANVSTACRLNVGAQLTELGKNWIRDLFAECIMTTRAGKCFHVVDRVGVFLSTPSQSDYNFQLENTVVRETMASEKVWA